jgi:hypothetical protein
VALGNHDLKGCRPVAALERWETCLGELRDALVADGTARYVRQGLPEAAARERAAAEAALETASDVAAEALATRKANCLPADATAYGHAAPPAQSCHAAAALEHAQFGFGSILRGDPPSPLRQRYYSVAWPLPALTREGEAKDPGAPEGEGPLVDVLVLDSNTLRVDGGLLGPGGGAPAREDRLQLLWLRNALGAHRPAARGGTAPWKILAMHHPPHSPRACACRVFGKCLGGHGDEAGLREQFRGALQGVAPPDLMMTAHNHIYARSHPLDDGGRPVTAGADRAIRYFVTGGGGAPLYDVHAPDPRFAKALTTHHFVYLRLTATSAFFWAMDAGGKVKDSGCFEKGSNLTHPLRADFAYDDALPPRCAAE